MSRVPALQALALGALLAPGFAAAETIEIPTFDIVDTTPLSGGGIEAAQVPASVWRTDAADISTYKNISVPGALAQRAPGVTVNNVSGNDFQPDISYRGFNASPVSGTPQGLAVYQDGVRINEAFGDTVNWDFIPANAIDTMTIVSGDPIFGLNAIGGALTITMKNGFTWQGFEADLRGGSFNNVVGAFQFGKQIGDWAVYAAYEQLYDGGWRTDGYSKISRFYGDLGYRANALETHLNVTAANNGFGAAAATPLQLLQNDWGSVYTVPQTTTNQMTMISGTAKYAYSNTLSLQGSLYFRAFNQTHVDGNTTDVEECEPYACLDGNPLVSTLGQIVPDISQDGALDLGQTDRTWTQSRSVGGTVQAVQKEKLFGHDNTFTVGVSLDHGWTNFRGNSELGVVTAGDGAFPVIGSGFILNDPDSYLAPVNVNARNTYTGVYALDTFSVTDRLAVTAGARFNYAAINLDDQNGGLITGNSNYSRVNPVVGLTYKVTPDVSFYAGFSQANRAPTPLELGCADPEHPCIIDNFLVSDPALKQIVGTTWQTGFRGKQGLGDYGALTWSAGLFRTTLQNDILPLQSPENGFGYYANVGTTLRQGAEVSANWAWDRWTAYANYTYLDARYLTTFMEPSPNNPLADEMGQIPIYNGTQIAGIPRNTVKAGVTFAITPQWKVGGEMVAASGQTIFGAENGAFPQLPGYAVFNARMSYQASNQLQFYGLIQNVFNQKYYTYGTLFETDALPITAPGLTDPRTLGPAKPFAIYAGLNYKM